MSCFSCGYAALGQCLAVWLVGEKQSKVWREEAKTLERVATRFGKSVVAILKGLVSVYLPAAFLWPADKIGSPLFSQRPWTFLLCMPPFASLTSWWVCMCPPPTGTVRRWYLFIHVSGSSVTVSRRSPATPHDAWSPWRRSRSLRCVHPRFIVSEGS